MSGCRLQAREAQQQQQPTTNERLMAARARAPHEAERQRGAHQRAVVNDGKEEKASLWLQAREAQQQQQPTTNERLLAASALPVAASKSTTRGRETLKHQ